MPKGNVKQRPNRLYYRHYKKIAQTTTKRILSGEQFVEFFINGTPEWPEDFPKNLSKERNKHKFNCKELLTWLHLHDKVSYSYDEIISASLILNGQIVGATNAVDRWMREFDRRLELNSDEEQQRKRSN